MSRTLRLVAAVVLSLLLIALAACGGGGEEKATETPGGATATTAAQTTPTEAGATATPSEGGVAATATVPPAVTVDVNKSFWHAGWKVTLGEATFAATIDDWGIRTTGVSIEATFENLGDDIAAFNSQLVLVAGGQNYTEPTSDQEIPEVPGKLSQTGKITFAVDPDFDFDDAVLIIGRPDNNQARVPLGPRGGELVSLEPQPLSVSGQVTASDITVNVTGGEIRADTLDPRDEVREGHLALYLYYSATKTGSYASGSLSDGNFTLKLPDGTGVPGEWGSIESVREGATTLDLWVQFEIKDPPQGAYLLILGGIYGAGGDLYESEMPMPFQIP
jgi:hypothetical protein